jgi:transposase
MGRRQPRLRRTGLEPGLEIRIVGQLDTEIDRLDTRIADVYDQADAKAHIRSAPGVGPVLAGGILGRPGDANRFATLSAVRRFSGIIPAVDQSGTVQTRMDCTQSGRVFTGS